MKNIISFIGLVTTIILSFTTTAAASNETDKLFGQLGLGCKNRIIEEFDVPNSDITVRLGATVQENLDSGAMSAKDLGEHGASFNWSVAGKQANGYCNVDGMGKVTQFEQW